MGGEYKIRWWSDFDPSDRNTWIPAGGNWGGPGWSGGERVVDDSTINWTVLPAKNAFGQYSQVDTIMKQHDRDYADAKGLPNEASLVLEADMRMLDSMSQMNFSQMDSDEKTYAYLATEVFKAKIVALDVPMAVKEQVSGLHDAIVTSLHDSVSSFAQAMWNAMLPKDLNDVEIGMSFTAAQYFVPRRDPLTIDLDGDGIETVPASVTNPILFDHDGDGIKTGTGWVHPDDGFLTLDRNSNGVIDNGTELFGDATPLYAGGTAADGFDALGQEDTNGDGKVNSLDANWASLKVWRDLNQDAISQADELFTMGQAGIAEFNVARIFNNQVLPDGNQIADLGTYTKTDGSVGTMGDVSQMADVNLFVDTFHQEFPDHIPLAPGVDALPEMEGSGSVRDLHEAASQSLILQDLLTQYSQAATRQDQLALLDQMLDAWADTCGMSETLDDRDPVLYHVRYDSFGSVSRYANIIGTEEGEYVRDVDNENLTPEYRQLIAEWNQKLHILEAFNGRYFFSLPDETQEGLSAFMGLTVEESGDVDTLVVNYQQGHLDLLDQAYEALCESVYSTLVSQTRFKPLFDQIDLVIENDRITWDFSNIVQHFQDEIAQNTVQGMTDLIEFNRYAGSSLSTFGWEGNERMAAYIGSLPITSELQAVYSELDVLIDGQTGFTNYGTEKSEVIVAGNTGGYIYGNDGDDVLIGGAGADYLQGDAGNDMIKGGGGNDTLYGGDGNDTYIFRRGDGQDMITSEVRRWMVSPHGARTG